MSCNNKCKAALTVRASTHDRVYQKEGGTRKSRERSSGEFEDSATPESGLEGNHFFEAEQLGLWILSSAGLDGQRIGEIVGINLVDAETMPIHNAWFKNFLEVPIIK